MPKYIYRFEDGVTVEVSQSIHSDTLERLRHPDSGKEELVTRVPAKVGVILKGKGFYKNDKGKK